MTTDITPAVTTPPLRSCIAEEIRALLGRRSMSKLALSQLIGKSHTYVWRRLNGETAFDVDDLERIASVLDVGVLDLFPARLRGGSTREQHQPVDPLAARVVATIGATRPQRHSPVSHKPPTAASPVPKSRPGVRVTRTQPVQPLAPCVR